MNDQFDEIIDRRGTNCLKYDFAKERGKGEDVLPLWVADMDFRTAPQIVERLHRIVDHGIFGYSDTKEDYFRAVAGWYERHFGWTVQRSWLVKTPGVVFAIAAAIRAFTQEGDGVLIQQPVYYPFSETIRDNGRTLVNSPLALRDGRYEMDFEDLERKIREERVKLFLLCSPHNPVGRVWEEQELRRVGDLCLKYGVKVVSDEIHSDFVWPGRRHQVFAGLGKEYEDISVICTAPSKTFNLAGLQASNIFIPNGELRARFRRAVDQAGYSQLNVMGLAACQAAYEEGEDWLRDLKEYLRGNLDVVREYVSARLPGIRMIEPEGTYLVWLDLRELGLDEAGREELIGKKARLWLDSGAMFGPDGEGFERVNIACPRAVLTEALGRLAEALEGPAAH
ncbi:MAG: MalY/PatB family protein [Eubacteriales bacterium]|nr:MalY/PatB family protein [Eubacteriales bacterium]